MLRADDYATDCVHERQGEGHTEGTKSFSESILRHEMIRKNSQA